jgi:hypothetical protein
VVPTATKKEKKGVATVTDQVLRVFKSAKFGSRATKLRQLAGGSTASKASVGTE